ncbi:hypothetical protein [Hyphomonas oceanitis]|uniref:ankyrin repeat domain-containing protein n=1 Tax=Hyphomonas oceanitis TaxID=81033 RepID=UPI0030020D88
MSFGNLTSSFGFSLTFWAIAGAEACALLFIFVSSLGQPQYGGNDGGREMAFVFFILTPGIVLLLCMLLFAFSSSPLWRVLALLAVIGPGLLLLGNRVRSAAITHQIAQMQLGRGYFATRPLNDMGAAVVACDTAAMQSLAPAVDLNAMGKYDMTLLALAVDRARDGAKCTRGSRLDVVKDLLALGANGDSGLDGAFAASDSRILGALLEAGANPNHVCSYGTPLVFRWCSSLPLAHLRMLIAHGLDLDAKEYGAPLALVLALNRRWDLVEVLIQSGADWRIPREDGRNVSGELVEQLAELRAEKKAVPPVMLRVGDLLNSAPQQSDPASDG